MAYSTIADLTVDEFRGLIKEVVSQTLLELLGDPDEGLELQEEIKARLQKASITPMPKTKLVLAQNVAAKLGLEW